MSYSFLQSIKSYRRSFVSTLSVVGLASIFLFAGQLHATVWSEIGDGGSDAGALPASAQLVPVGGTTLDSITGTLSLSLGISEADMYEIYISDPANFSATTTGFSPGVNGFDSQLFLFTLGGVGIYSNDDDPSSGSPQSTLPAGTAFMSSLSAGYYYLLITGSGQYPTSAGGLIFPNFTDGITDPTGVYGPTGAGGGSAMTGYTGSSNEGGNYSIALTGVVYAPVPEPSEVALVLFGLTTLVGFARRRAALK